MLKKLLVRHRAMRLGVTIVGASALAVGFASPAFAAQSVNNGRTDQPNAQNYIVVQGGSNTAYGVMSAEAALFNSAPGCDLVGQNSSAPAEAQPLDYGCPGMGTESGTTEAGTAQSGATVATYSADISASGLKSITLTGGSVPFSDLSDGDQVTDNGGVIPTADPLTKVKNSGVVKLQFKTTGSDTTDTISVNYIPQQGENGYTQWGAENPFNDVVVEEPSYGSGNGIGELEGTGGQSGGVTTEPGDSIQNPDNNTGSPVNVAPIDAARSSAAPALTTSYASGGFYSGLNFVAYAEDAVSYLYWTSYGSTAETTADKCISHLQANGGVTTADLKEIWNQSYTGSTPGITWNTLDPSDPTDCPSTPLYAYWAQSGSGTQKTWASATGAAFPASGHWPSRNIIFENETSAITGNNSNAPVGDAIFFFSYGAFLHKCTPAVTTPGDTGYLNSTNPVCAGNSSADNAVQLGTTWVGTNGSVTVEPSTINAQLPGSETSEFPGDRLLYNVYSDGSNSNLPVASDQTLNFLSEDGFMCKPSTATDVDPATGATFRSEIDTNLADAGFLPLPNLQVEDGQGDSSGGYGTTKTGIGNPAYNELHGSAYDSAKETGSPWNFAAADVDTDSSAWSGTYQADDGSLTPQTENASGTAPIGYCITMTTDGDTAGAGSPAS